jgi:histidinol dehydrogenase
MSLRRIDGLKSGRAYIARLRAVAEGGGETTWPPSASPSAPASGGRGRSVIEHEASRVEEAVAQIVSDVRRGGDSAVREVSRRIDGASLDTLWVGTSAMQAAYSAAPPELRAALHLAASRIRAFHEREPHHSWLEWDAEGNALGQRIHPIQRVGVYVPGGTAAYPSSLLMAVIPAQVAGVQEIIVTTPPGRDGSGAAATLAAGHVVGLKQLFLVGGAQAIAALAYGTESIPRVDKIVGAGGLFVTLAKKLVYGDVGIDGLNGPTETVLIADETARPKLVAADLLAQAEHDPLATALLITPSSGLATAVQAEVNRQLPEQARREILSNSLAGQGAILCVANLDEAVALANEYAPEHLCLLVADPWSLVGRVHNAGGIFVGEASSEALGDYVVGPSHIMPTRATARFASPLHVGDFLKVTSIFAVGEAVARQLSEAAMTLAEAEGLSAHAAAVAARSTTQLPQGDEPHGT